MHARRAGVKQSAIHGVCARGKSGGGNPGREPISGTLGVAGTGTVTATLTFGGLASGAVTFTGVPKNENVRFVLLGSEAIRKKGDKGANHQISRSQATALLRWPRFGGCHQWLAPITHDRALARRHRQRLRGDVRVRSGRQPEVCRR